MINRLTDTSPSPSIARFYAIETVNWPDESINRLTVERCGSVKLKRFSIGGTDSRIILPRVFAARLIAPLIVKLETARISVHTILLLVRLGCIRKDGFAVRRTVAHRNVTIRDASERRRRNQFPFCIYTNLCSLVFLATIRFRME